MPKKRDLRAQKTSRPRPLSLPPGWLAGAKGALAGSHSYRLACDCSSDCVPGLSDQGRIVVGLDRRSPGRLGQVAFRQALQINPDSANAHNNLAITLIAKNYDESIPIIGHLDYCVSSLSGYLARPIFYPAGNTYGTCNTQNQALRRPVNLDSLLAQTIHLMRDKGSNILLV
jgi:hypothetical protein